MEIQFIFWLIILVMSVVIHEVSHGYVAQMFGDPTPRLQGRLTLNPIPHFTFFGSLIVPLLTFFGTMGNGMFGWANPVIVNPYNFSNPRKAEFFIALAGPLSNLIIAILFGSIIRIGLNYSLLPVSFLYLSAIVVTINLTLAVFNLIPIPPLDGSKILFSVLPNKYKFFQNYMEMYSIVLILLLILVLWRFIQPIIPFIFTLLTGQ